MTENKPQHVNRLAAEASPYLLQHSHNPVDWYPWGDEALAKARAEDRPILLSVGYSACHWCHVMERESFENPEIAALMNRDFVNIKVDREERPDVDAIYMAAVQAMTGQGGWPMTVFLTPDARPFYGGTYYPPQDYHGRPGFPRLLAAIADAWRTRRAELVEQSDALARALGENDDAGGSTTTVLTAGMLDRAYRGLVQGYDQRNGGFGSAPKFPQPASLEFLLRFHVRSGQKEPLAMVQQTLWAMALGGIYDQLGGGFHRYSTDATWLVPHFEKMLYDNAQLAQVYARCYQTTGVSFFRGIAEQTIEYVLREMTGPEGCFYSAQDADSEGEEGRFFVWSWEEIDAALEGITARSPGGDVPGSALFQAFYDLSEQGNWEHKNILHVVTDTRAVAEQFGVPLEEAVRALDQSRTALLAVRERRVKPGLDDKALTAWNGLMLAAVAECGAILGRPEFVEAAARNARFLRDRMTTRDADGALRLRRSWRGGQARLNGYLEDYAFVADGLLRLYEATFDAGWVRLARELVETMLARFWDEASGGFYATSDDHEALIHRPKDYDDNATPSGNSVAADVLLRLSALTGEMRYRDRAGIVLRRAAGKAEQLPYSFGRLLSAADAYLAPQREVAIIGPLDAPETLELLAAVRRKYRPNVLVAAGNNGDADTPELPLLQYRKTIAGIPTAYVCENQTCRNPVISAADLEAQLDS